MAQPIHKIQNKIRAKKSLGQHFLNSKSVLEKIIAAAKIVPDETILEIGPGTGILTRALLEAGANVIAVEKDIRISNIEIPNSNLENRLTLVGKDILDFDSHSYLPAPGSYAVVANIPYYITGAILEKFLENEPRPNRMVLLVQKEVAERIVARDNKESILSVSVKTFGEPKIIDNVPRGAFSPPPNVDSAILSISNITGDRFEQEKIDIKKFFRFVRAGFAHKRKFLKRNLEEVASTEAIERVWAELNLDPKIRAEDLSVSDWFRIAKLLR